MNNKNKCDGDIVFLYNRCKSLSNDLSLDLSYDLQGVFFIKTNTEEYLFDSEDLYAVEGYLFGYRAGRKIEDDKWG